MLEYDIDPHTERHPVFSLLLIVGVVFAGFVVIGPGIGFLLSLPLFPGTFQEYLDALQHIEDHPEVKMPLFIMQGCATFIGLIVGPSLLLNSEGKRLSVFFQGRGFQLIPAVITAVTVVVFMAVNSVLIEWNASIHFPAFLKGIETWARENEDKATIITEFLTRFDSPFQLVVGMLVIAVLPAIGEEIVFRGFIQNEFFRGTKNIHLSIWVSAILFSAIHMQFFGFIPRLVLGALFGYLYYWSGSLSLAILAHFVNNGISVMAIYFYQQGYFEFDVEGTEAAPWQAVLFSAIVTCILLYSFRRYYRQPSATP